jgi:hypothetical protein
LLLVALLVEMRLNAAKRGFAGFMPLAGQRKSDVPCCLGIDGGIGLEGGEEAMKFGLVPHGFELVRPGGMRLPAVPGIITASARPKRDDLRGELSLPLLPHSRQGRS